MAQDHFERHNHYEGVVDWNFNVTFRDQPSIAVMADAYRPFLTRPDLYDPIPTEWLHATILRVGTVDQFTTEEMLAVSDEVQNRLNTINLPEFHLGACKILFGNICFPIEPEAALEQLYTVVTESLEEVVGPERATKSPYGRFIAHTSFVYSKARSTEQETADIIAAAHIPAASFKISHMPLIKQKPINGHYEWEVVKDIIVH